jgi:hypothetical protein
MKASVSYTTVEELGDNMAIVVLAEIALLPLLSLYDRFVTRNVAGS